MGTNNGFVPDDSLLGRERKTLEMRRAGASFDEIAQATGYSDRAAAHKAFKRALARTLQQPAAELRELEQDRLDRLLLAVWPRAMRGELGAIDRALRVAERRARLMGLDHADGIAERQVRLAELQAQLLLAGLGGLAGKLRLTGEQQQVWREEVPLMLRALGREEAGMVALDAGPATLEGETA
jgi:hypothetical protein